MTSDAYSRIQLAASVLREHFDGREPRAALVLGSALGPFAEAVIDAVSVPFDEIPHVRSPTAQGHAGRFVAGTVRNLPVLVMSGRLHAYEGWSLEDVTFPIRVIAALGIETIVLTNAAGGVDLSLAAGDLMVIEDHLNLTGIHPLTGPNDERLGPRFPDMTNAYDPELREMFYVAAAKIGLTLRGGVYAGLSGPSYETPAEVRMLRAVGAHAVGMSTVHEAIVARHSGLRLAGISCITNAAAGESSSPLSHTEVMNTALRSAEAFQALLEGFCEKLAS
ncbi:MAG: purine-nucleoside phosphorylase [Blastocatellia bacterium]|nr:purine-nucleoside phosphorylase [Blastocatellia bacterium]